MRLFCAIDLDGDARESIANEQRRIADNMAAGGQSLRLVRPEHFHLTLVFIGEIGDAAAEAVVNAMCLDLMQPPFSLVFGGAGVFPARGSPRAMWMGIREGAQQAADLQAEVSGRLAGAGAPVDGRPFRPHLTLARWRDASRSRPDLDSVPLEVARVRVDAVTLYQSRLSSAGPAYTALTRARLTGLKPTRG